MAKFLIGVPSKKISGFCGCLDMLVRFIVCNLIRGGAMSKKPNNQHW
jgi:hypothetical protein